MERWFLVLPDILVFISIFGFGFFMGVFVVGMIVFHHARKGNTLVIKEEEF